MNEKIENSKIESNKRGVDFLNSVSIIGAGLYDLEGYFFDVSLKGEERVHLHSTRLGNVVDAAESELTGEFDVTISNYIGACKYSLEEVEDGAGEMELTIFSKDGKKVLGTFIGASEGFGEAFVIRKKGHLHVHPSEHNNIVEFIGDSSIKKIAFELDEFVHTKGQPYHGVHWDIIDNKENQLKIDAKAGRKNSKNCADFFNDSVGNSNDYMMHTDGGSSKPSELNFAFTGILYIDDQEFEISLGQGHHGAYNNWFLASFDMKPTKHHKSGDLGKFHISTDGSNKFKVKKKS
jgi:hypothetical protein